MNFKTDKQTLEDLNIFGKPGKESVFNIYNHTHTRGGADLLEQMFLYPMSDAEAINNRSCTIQYFSKEKLAFPFKADQLDSAEIYLSMTDQRSMLSHDRNSLGQKFSQLLSANGDYKLIFNGIVAVIDILQTLDAFLKENGLSIQATPYQSEQQNIEALLSDEPISSLLKETGKPPYNRIVDLDKLLRFQQRLKIKQVLSHIYAMDVFISIAQIALKYNYVFPEALDKELHTVKLTEVYHPLVKNARANTLHISPENNIVFLTGANMAGKSTLMKSIGIALYLAHMGFPVAAARMEFSIRDGLYTTINLPDDLGSGNSHFYAEVLRIKKIAKELGRDKNLFIIFDELFRGTNVKDAFEGTVALTQAFAGRRNCMFVVSTHIIEAGDVLRERCSNINFVYLPTKMDGNTPVYTYKLEPGITADRHGMIIINNERILEIIRSRKNKTTL